MPAPEEDQQLALGRVPVPDPTKLTTDAVNAATSQWRRDLDAMRELIETRLDSMDKATQLLAGTVGKVPSETDKAISALRELIEARINAMDKATELLASALRQFPSDLDKTAKSVREILSGEIRNVESVALEKFTAIEGTFASNALALTAALAAQKEAAAEQNKSNTLAITKSETATKETILANQAQTQTSIQSQAENITDLKERLVRLESGGLATATANTEHRADATFDQTGHLGSAASTRATISAIIAGLAVVIAMVSVILLAIKK